MHDDTFLPVKDALGHYMEGGSLNPRLEKEIHALDFLSFGEREDILAFLDSLTAPLLDNLRPPAGLTTKQTAQNGRERKQDAAFELRLEGIAHHQGK